MFVCQVLCTGIQGIYALLMGGPSAKVCLSAKFLCTSIQGIYALLLGGPLAKDGSSAKYEHTSIFTLASQRSFRITYERPIKA